MRKLIPLVLLWSALSSFGSHSLAACTISQSCNNSCSLQIECPPPYLPWVLVCSAPSQVVSCSGVSCSNTATSVTCDGATVSCWANWCFQTSTSVSCGNTVKTCQRCQASGNCPL